MRRARPKTEELGEETGDRKTASENSVNGKTGDGKLAENWGQAK
jgi:hypothetical protein